jgi:MmgE/PrpD N-terminal domain
LKRFRSSETSSIEETMIGSGTLTKQIASYLACTGYGALNDDALRATKDHFLYTLGTILAGSSAPGIKQALAGAQALGGGQESTVFVHGQKLPAPSAALVNATMGHSRELDINDDRIAYKSSVTVIPAALVSPKKSGAFTLAPSRWGHSRPPRRAARFSASTRMACTTRSASPFAARRFQATARLLRR